jgi:hypothetical protein
MGARHLYRLTNGGIGGRFIAGSPILLLTTTGRRTGKLGGQLASSSLVSMMQQEDPKPLYPWSISVLGL